LGGDYEMELIPGAAGAAKTQANELEDAFEVRKQHLHLLPLIAW
jgi:hypothetical protein